MKGKQGTRLEQDGGSHPQGERRALTSPITWEDAITASVDCRECGARSGEKHLWGCDIYSIYGGDAGPQEQDTGDSQRQPGASPPNQTREMPKHSAIDRAKNPPRPAYRPVLATSRHFEDDLLELRAAAVRDAGGDTGLFAMAFEHLGRQMVLHLLTDEEIVTLGVRVMVSAGIDSAPFVLDVDVLTDEQIESLYGIERPAMRHALETFAAMQSRARRMKT